MSRWTPTFRADVIKQLKRAKEQLEKKKRSETEIIFGLAKRFHPSKREFSYIFSPVQIEQNGMPNHFALTYGNQIIRVFNKKHLLNQEIIAVEKKDIAANGKEIRRSLLDAAYGDNAGKAADKQKPIIDGGIEKEKRLRDKQRNGRKIKREADKLEQRIYS